jgi:hypothetical protein
MIAVDPADEIDPDQYHDLADLLLIDWARDKSPKTASSERDGSERYGALPMNLTGVSSGIAALLLGAAALTLRFFHRPLPFLGPLGAEQHRLPLELSGTVVAIIGLAGLILGLFPPTYTVTLSRKTWVRARKVVANLLASGDPYTKRRCGDLIANVSQADARNFSVDGSFDWLLLLYLASESEQIAQLEPAACNQLKRARRSILFLLDRAGLIRKIGWFSG